MVRLSPRWCGAALAATFLFALNTRPSIAGDGPNRPTPSDRAAGMWFDSLLDQDLHAAKQPSRRRAPRRSVRQSSLRGKLVNNPNTDDGAPEYALVDRYGGVLRYVEPVDRVHLSPHLGQMVSVRHDTGDILLASQLALPAAVERDLNFQLAQHEESIPAGEIIDEGIHEPSILMDSGGPVYLDEGIPFGECPDCGSYTCGSGVGGCYGAHGGRRGYVRAEYLLWFFDGMDTPPLVTMSDPIDGGVLPNFPGDNPSTRIVLGGNDSILDDSRNGVRIIAGVWIDDQARQALELDYFGFATLTDSYTFAGEDGNPTISRPFFDLFPDDDDNGIIDIPPSEAAQEVSSATLNGSVTVEAESEFHSFGIRLRHNLCCTGGCPCDCGAGIGCGAGVGFGGIHCGSGCGSGASRRVALLTGFRYARLDEDLRITENLVVDADDVVPRPVGIPADGTIFIVRDRFATENEFVGGELGFLWEIERRRWSLELLSKLAVGNTHQRVFVDGSTQVITDPPTVPAPDPSEGGLLAQTTNIGSQERDEFSVIPEVGFTLGYKLTPRLRLTAGYTLFYWTNVVRPGDQIDREINGANIPDFDVDGTPIPRATLPPLRPELVLQNTDFWGQGINVGADYRW